MEAKKHWEHIYGTKDPSTLSWTQAPARASLEFIKRTGIPKDAAVIDVGGGTSTLVDDLLAENYHNLTVLDISGEALAVARKRIGVESNLVTWLVADITAVSLPPQFYDLWHDRAVFHFLTDPAERSRYVKAVMDSVKIGGHVIVSTFAIDGPSHCSGLEVCRYDSNSLHSEFGDEFRLVDSTRETHHTPIGTEQKFIYCYCRKEITSSVDTTVVL